MEDVHFNLLLKKIDLLAGLLLRLVPQRDDMTSVRHQIKVLNELGARPIDIAGILGRNPKFVNKELTVIRRKKRDKREKG
jgi:hypothetical protein